MDFPHLPTPSQENLDVSVEVITLKVTPSLVNPVNMNLEGITIKSLSLCILNVSCWIELCMEL